MTCVSDRTRATLRVAIVGLLAALGACTDGPNLPPDAEPELLSPAGPAQKIYPIAGVTGTANCPTNYISDGVGGCIYAPSTGDDWGTSGGGTTTGTPTGTSGGSTGSTNPDDGSTCDPRTDPECEKPLSAADTTMIRKALADFVLPDSAIADTTARRQCGEMRQQFQNSLAGGAVFRGGSNMTDSLAHYGATYDGRIHFDPWLLDLALTGDRDAQREVANTALHEAGHVLGKRHGTPTMVNGYDVYTDPYFNLLSPGPNTCIRY